MARREHSGSWFWAAVGTLVFQLITPSVGIRAGEQPFPRVPIDPGDRVITDVLQKRLFADPAVPSAQVHIDSTAGIVSLRGTVGTLAARARAGQIAATTPGVVSVINDLEVAHTAARSDADVGREVRYVLGNADPLLFKNVRIRVDSGAVVLTGTVGTAVHRNQAMRLAQSVAGMASVENNIRVSSVGLPADSDIQDAIVEALRQDGLVNPAAMHVEVRSGRVRFSGAVASLPERVQAVRAAWAAGATAVDASGLALAPPSPLVVTPEMTYPVALDGRIKAAIEAALAQDGRVDSLPIRTDVARQVVTLRGAIASPAAKKVVGEIARRVDGVLEVVNQLNVEPSQRLMDEMIRDRMLGLVRSDPQLRVARIDAAVVNGAIRLSGIVESPADRRLVERLALRIPGVVDIDDELLMQHPKVSERPLTQPR